MHCNGSMLPIVQSFKVVLGQFGLQTVLKPLLTTAEHTTSVLKWNLQKAKKNRNTFKVYKCGSLNSICWLCAYLCQYYWRSVLFWLAGGIDRVHHQSPFCDYDHENRFVIMTMKTNDILTSLGTLGHWVRFNLSKLLQCFVSCFSLGTLYWSIEVLDTLFQWSMINDQWSCSKFVFLTISSACSAGSIIALQQGVLLSKVLDI